MNRLSKSKKPSVYLYSQQMKKNRVVLSEVQSKGWTSEMINMSKNQGDSHKLYLYIDEASQVNVNRVLISQRWRIQVRALEIDINP